MNFNNSEYDLDAFLLKAHKAFNIHAPTKMRYVRANNAPFMNKNLSKAIMTRNRLRNKFLCNKTETNWQNYKTQRNYCKKLLRISKKTTNIVKIRHFL